MLSRQLHLRIVITLALVLPRLASAADCNGNGVEDGIDISTGTSQDCQPNGIPDECDIRGLYAGTQSGTAQGQVGRVFIYGDGTNWQDITPDNPAWDVAAVMDLAYHDGHLYAGTQRAHGYAASGGGGQVWRYDGARTWILVGSFDQSVTVLEVMDGMLYAGTGNMSLRRCATCDGSDWSTPWTPGGTGNTGWRSGIVSDLCGSNSLYLGELNDDDIWRFNDTDGLVKIQLQGGSCIWDFADFTDVNGERHIYAGAHPAYPDGPVYKSDFPQHPSGTCTFSTNPLHNLTHKYGTYLYNWALESFSGMLYVGGGNQPSNQPSPNGGAKLLAFDGVNWQIPLPVVYTWPSTLTGEGVSAMAVHNGGLYVGLGVPDGYGMGSWEGRAEIWRTSDGVNFQLASPSDQNNAGIFGGGVQCLLSAGTSGDCNGNGVPDECDIASSTSEDCNLNVIPDEC